MNMTVLHAYGPLQQYTMLFYVISFYAMLLYCDILFMGHIIYMQMHNTDIY